MMSFSPPREIQLRDYQADAIEGLRDCIRQGKRRVILCAGTGAGKTVMASHLLREAKAKGSYSLFLVDRVALVKQTSDTLDEYGIPHGVLQGIHPRYSPNDDVQVCSIQTLARRTLPRNPALIVYDEAHAQYKSTLEYIEANPDAVVIGLTATPFAKGMGNFWHGMVNAIPTRKLIEGGHLVEPTIYVARSPDDAAFGINSYGEFSDASAASAGIEIIGDVVAEWQEKTKKHFGGPVKTIVFSPTVEHGRELCASFAAAGFNFQQVSYLDKSEEDRDAKIGEFRKADSEIHGLVSCGVLTKGFDVPDVRCGISCKPYRKSLSSHIQEIGRVMRSHPGKDEALWLCHSGNVERFALDTFDIWDNGPGELSKAATRDSTPRERQKAAKEAVVCAECGGPMRAHTCTSCGWERPARSNINHVEGVMQQFGADHMAIQPRDGLRAPCLADPRSIWRAALAYTSKNTRKGEDHARRWAYGVWCGVYPGHKVPVSWYYDQIRGSADQAALALIEREIKRFRKKGGKRK